MNTTLARSSPNPTTTSGFPAQSGHGQPPATIMITGSLSLISPLAGGNSVIPIETGFGSRHPGGPAVQRQVNNRMTSMRTRLSRRTDRGSAVSVIRAKSLASPVSDSVLNELAVAAVRSQGFAADATPVLPAHSNARFIDRRVLNVSGMTAISSEALPGLEPAERPADFRVRLAAILLAVGSLSRRARLSTGKNLKAGAQQDRENPKIKKSGNATFRA